MKNDDQKTPETNQLETKPGKMKQAKENINFFSRRKAR